MLPHLLLLSAVGMIFTICVFAPGYLTLDSIQQLTQARSGEFADWHPPVMAWLWSLLDATLPGPLGMLLFQNLLFWLGLFLFSAKLTQRSRLGAISVLCIGVFPPVLSLMGVVIKDAQFLAALTLTSGLLLQVQNGTRKSVLLPALIALFYAGSVRHNSPPAMLSLSLWWAHLAIRSKKIPSALAGVFLFIFLWIGSIQLNKAITKVHQYPIQQILLHDLAGISVGSRVNVLPSLVWPDRSLSVQDIEAIYVPGYNGTLYCCDREGRRLRHLKTDDQVSKLAQAWRSEILNHPAEYIRHRIAVFSTLMGFGSRNYCIPFQPGVDRNLLGISLRPSRLNQWVMGILEALKSSTLFAGIFYLLLNLLILCFALVKRPPHAVGIIAIGTSGLLYTFAYVIVGTSCEFRMLGWLVLSTLSMVALMIASVGTVHGSK